MCFLVSLFDTCFKWMKNWTLMKISFQRFNQPYNYLLYLVIDWPSHIRQVKEVAWSWLVLCEKSHILTPYSQMCIFALMLKDEYLF
jgi:hypothetical protein